MSDYDCLGYKFSRRIKRFQFTGIYDIRPCKCGFSWFAHHGISRVESSRISWGSPVRVTARRPPPDHTKKRVTRMQNTS